MALTPTEREEHFFKAMVDAADGSTPEELEPTERKEHWYKEIIDAIAAGGGGSGGDNRFIVTLTPTAADYSGTMDKTVAEINAAYEAGQEIWFEISDGYTTNRFAMTMIYRDGSAYPSFTGYIIYHDMIINAATGSTDLGTSNTYNTDIYTLTPAT